MKSETDHLLAALKHRIESRGAIDYLNSLVDCFDGHFGSFLVQKQIDADHDRHCPDCNHDALDNEIIED